MLPPANIYTFLCGYIKISQNSPPPIKRIMMKIVFKVMRDTACAENRLRSQQFLLKPFLNLNVVKLFSFTTGGLRKSVTGALSQKPHRCELENFKTYIFLVTYL